MIWEAEWNNVVLSDNKTPLCVILESVYKQHILSFILEDLLVGLFMAWGNHQVQKCCWGSQILCLGNQHINDSFED